MDNEIVSFLSVLLLIIGAVFIISPAVLAVEVAGRKNRSKFFWFFVGLFYNFIGVIVICLMPDKYKQPL